LPRLTKTDAALRAIIFGKAPLKTKLEALAGMAAPSETFLLELVASPETHSKLKLKATEYLKHIRQAREVDEILAAESLRLGLNGPVAAEPVRKPDGPQAVTSAVVRPVAASPAQPTRIEAPISSQEPKPAKPPYPAPSLETATPADPQPIFILPRGSFISDEEQSRMLQLFRTIADKTKSETVRRGARAQLNRVVAIPDAARSLFSIYLLAMLDWLERNPEKSTPEALADNSPVTESNLEHELFSHTFAVNQSLRQRMEEDRARRQIERANAETKGGGMWEGLPAI
jgi:hypothetical protein